MEIQYEDGALTVHFPAHTIFKNSGKRLVHGPAPAAPPPRERGRLHRITRLMALAIHFQKLISQGIVKDYAEIAALSGLTRARITQIMNLNLLAPAIQEEILFMPRIEKGDDKITERNIRHIAAEPIWAEQMKKWREITA